MKDALEFRIHGIKCDSCDYKDENVKVEEYNHWVNKPCPTCGANLLTEADFENVQTLMRIAKIANNIFPKRENDEQLSTMSVKMNGTGKMDFEITP